MIEVQCTSCHTRYRIDEQVLPEGVPTFKCSRCGHVFTFEPRKSRLDTQGETAASKRTPVAGPSTEPSAAGTAEPEATEPAGSVGVRESRFHEESVATSAQDVADPGRINKSARFQSEPTKSEAPARKPQPEAPGLASPGPRDEPQAPQGSGTSQPSSSPQLAAEQAREFYSRLFTGKDPNASPGENLSFDFPEAEEEPVPDPPRLTRRARGQESTPRLAPAEAPQWQVGDEELLPKVTPSIASGPFSEKHITRPSRRRTRKEENEPAFSDDDEFTDEEAPVYNRRITHSARFFVLLMFLIGAGFAGLTLAIHNSPGTSSAVLGYLPLIGDRFVLAATPAKLVALRDVNAAYQENKEGHKAVVISGTAENVGTASLRIVQLTAALRDSQRRSLAAQAVYCGNNVSPGMISQMTPHEIDFFQKLEPAKTFALEPAGSCRFVAVFTNPPAAAKAYDVSVSQAVPGTGSNAEDPRS